jgi:sterol desaturase/sphingolipid hydroxylase (fatty acid hydroxylase superfamily)
MISAPAFVALWAVLLPGIALAAWRSAPVAAGTVAGLLIAGVLLWTFTEYALHRFLFHWQPRSARLAALVFILHGNHHAAPTDRLRNLMPPIVSVPVGSAVWAACTTLGGPMGSWLFLGFVGGYVGYDLVHYACHQWPMRGRLLQAVKQNHMKHHHGRQTGNYAITGMIWDRLLGTRIRAARR